MKRRDFLKVGGAALGLPLDGALPYSDDPAVAAEQFGPQLDRLLAGLAEAVRLDGPTLLSPDAAVRARSEGILRALTLVGQARALPRDALQSPAVLTKLTAMRDEVNKTLIAVVHDLGQLREADHDRLRRRLREEPDRIARLDDLLDRCGAGIGIPFGRRKSLGGMLRQLSWRLEKQPPGLLVDENLTRLRREAARLDAADALAPIDAPQGDADACDPAQRATIPDEVLERRARIFGWTGIALMGVELTTLIAAAALGWPDFGVVALVLPCPAVALLLLGLLYKLSVGD